MVSSLETNPISKNNLASALLKYKCNLCNAEFKTELEENDHMITHARSKAGFPCIKCFLIFPSDKSLTTHRSLCESNINKSNCKKCGKVFCKYGLLQKYPDQISIRQLYSVKPDKIYKHDWPVKKFLKCRQCSTTFLTKNALLRHRTTHKDNHSFKCVVCKGVFLDKQKFHEHESVHKDQAVRCPICSQRFLHSAYLVMHIHDKHVINFSVFKCHICEMSESDSALLTKHFMLHASNDSSNKENSQIVHKSVNISPQVVIERLSLSISTVPNCNSHHMRKKGRLRTQHRRSTTRKSSKGRNSCNEMQAISKKPVDVDTGKKMPSSMKNPYSEELNVNFKIINEQSYHKTSNNQLTSNSIDTFKKSGNLIQTEIENIISINNSDSQLVSENVKEIKKESIIDKFKYLENKLKKESVMEKSDSAHEYLKQDQPECFIINEISTNKSENIIDVLNSDLQFKPEKNLGDNNSVLDIECHENVSVLEELKICTTCSKNFTTMEELSRHVVVHI